MTHPCISASNVKVPLRVVRLYTFTIKCREKVTDGMSASALFCPVLLASAAAVCQIFTAEMKETDLCPVNCYVTKHGLAYCFHLGDTVHAGYDSRHSTNRFRFFFLFAGC